MFSIYSFADGAGTDDAVPRAMARWIRTQPPSRLIVYGGDIYRSGTEEQFEMFFDQMNQRRLRHLRHSGQSLLEDGVRRSASRAKSRPGYDKFWRPVSARRNHKPRSTRGSTAARATNT